MKQLVSRIKRGLLTSSIAYFLLGCFFCVYSQQAQLYIQSGHSAKINSIAFTSDGDYIASASDDNSIRLWHFATGKEIKSVPAHKGFVTALAFNYNSTYLISGGWDNEVKIWSFPEFTEIGMIKGKNEIITALAAHPTKNIVAYGTGYQYIRKSINYNVTLYDINDKKILNEFPGTNYPITSIDISKDEKYIAYSSGDKIMRIYSLLSGELKAEIMTDSDILSLIFSPNSEFLAIGLSNGIVNILNTDGFISRNSFTPSRQPIRSIRYSSDSKLLAASCDDNSIYVFDIDNNNLKGTLNGHSDKISTLRYHPQTNILASGSFDKTIKLWNAGEIIPYQDLSGKIIPVWSLDIDNDNPCLAYCTSDGYIQVWDFQSGRTNYNYKVDDKVTSNLTFSPDNKSIAVSSTDKIYIFDRISRSVSSQYNNLTPISALKYKSDGSLLAAQPNNNFLLNFPKNDLSENHKINIGIGNVNTLEISPDQKRIILSTLDKSLIDYDLTEGKEASRLTGVAGKVNAMSISPNGTILAVGSDDNLIRIFDLGNRKITETIKTYSSQISFSPDGNFIAFGSSDFSVKLYDIKTKKISPLVGHSGKINTIKFIPGTDYLISSSSDNIVKLWNSKSVKEVVSIVFLQNNDWAVIAADGRFDATPEGRKLIHYVKNNLPIALDAFFEKYYTPKLLSLILNGKQGSAIDESDFLRKVIAPPPINLYDSKDNHLTDKMVYKIKFNVMNEGAGIEEIKLYQNGKIYIEEKILPSETNNSTISRTYNSVLVPGKNEFRLTAFDKNRTESERTINIKLQEDAPSSSLFAIVVGINEHNDESYNLKYAKSDAKAFINSIDDKDSKLFKEVIKFELYDKEATRENIENVMTIISTLAKPLDAFVFYFAGHGMMMKKSNDSKEYYLVTCRSDDKNTSEKSSEVDLLSTKRLKEMFQKVKSLKQLIIFDACHSGGAVEDLYLREAAEERVLVQLAKDAGVFVIASSGIDQKSIEYDKLKHGIFTYALVKGLQGEADFGAKPDGKITVKELELYLNQKIPELSNSIGGRTQYPYSFSLGRDFIITIIGN